MPQVFFLKYFFSSFLLVTFIFIHFPVWLYIIHKNERVYIGIGKALVALFLSDWTKKKEGKKTNTKIANHRQILLDFPLFTCNYKI